MLRKQRSERGLAMADSINWKARLKAVSAADGDQWDELSEAFDQDWIAAYRAAFVRCAVARPGWTEATAKEWLDAADLPRDALVDAGWKGEDPAERAAEDVIECEIEAANA
jgi:hypothetical protein